MIEFRVLGPVEVVLADQVVPGWRPQQRAVLAALVVDVGRVVPVGVLVDRVWGSAPPRHADRILQSHLSRIRRTLDRGNDPAETVRLVRHAGGYRLLTEPDRVDLYRFRRLLQQDRAQQQVDDDRIASLRQALDLWRGEPLGGVPGDWAARTRQAWQQLRLDATVLWADLQLQVGGAAAVIDPLAELLADHPLAEPLAGVLIRALYAVGRPADALDLYATVRRRLADQLGTDPSAELQRLQQAILRGELVPPTAQTVAVHSMPVPAQLPTAVPDFTGRADQLAELDELMSTGDGNRAATRIAAVAGGAGVGKTALALHWAHRVAGRFPDGQVYLDLQGYDPNAQPLKSAEALGRLLTAVGLDRRQLPPGEQERSALWRTVLASRSVLVVLDNAVGAQQVRPLLPASPLSLTIVTSRNRLAGLVAVDGAHPIVLGPMSEVDATTLLTDVLGKARATADPDAVRALARLCGYLPLALRLAAAWLLTRPYTIAEYVRELVAAGPLTTLQVRADARASVVAAFDLSYNILPPAGQRLFRRLGLVSGADWTCPVAAVLNDTDEPETAALVGTLVDTHLVEEYAPRRYRMHDLLRQYAHDRAQTDEAAHDRREAIRRVLAWYLQIAREADEVLYPRRPRPGTSMSSSHAAAVLLAEQHNIHAAIHQAYVGEEWTFAWQLTLAISRSHQAHNDWATWQSTHELAATAASRAGDAVAEAHVLNRLAECFLDREQLTEAATLFERALALHRANDECAGEADALRALGDIHRELGHLDEAERTYNLALSSALRGQDMRVESHIRRGLGAIYRETGQLDASVRYFEHALAIASQLGDRHWAAVIRRSLGITHRDAGRLTDAQQCFEQAFSDLQAVGDRMWQAYTLVSLSDVLTRQQDHEGAVEVSTRARTMARELLDRPTEAWAQLGLATALRGGGDLTAARTALQDGLDRFNDLGDRRLEASSFYQLGLVHRADRDFAAGRTALNRALDLFRQLGIVISIASTHLQIGLLEHDDGDSVAAHDAMHSALDLFKQLDVPHYIAKAEDALEALAGPRGEPA